MWATVSFSRGLFGKPKNPAHIEKVLKDLSLWDKKDAKIVTLSGGMKRRVMIAKALSHEPQILFLDEPTAGVDVELRKGMWEVVRTLQASGVTIILTTHYIEEAEEMADRVGVINKGEIILVEDKANLMQKLGKKQLKLHLQGRIDAIPPALAAYQPRTVRRRQRADLQLRHQGRAHRHHQPARRPPRPPASASPISTPARVRWKTSSSAWCGRHEFQGCPRDLQVRNGAHLAHAAAEHRFAGGFDLAVFRGVRRRDRLAHHPGRGRQLRHLHRAGAGDAVGADPEHRQCLVRHLFSEIRRHDLRDIVGADLLFRDRARLCRRGRDQIDHPRPDHSRHRRPVRAAANSSSAGGC